MFNPIAELVIIPSTEAKAATETHPVIAEEKIRKSSI